MITGDGGDTERAERRLETQLGGLRVVATGGALAAIDWAERPSSFAAGTGTDGADGTALAAVRQLAEYFRGERSVFDLPLSLPEQPPLLRRVLEELGRIPYGETVSYGSLAARCGRPGAARAVGNALGRNPLPLVLPCHRVIRSDGTPGGYGGGRDRKRRLLRLEGALRP